MCKTPANKPPLTQEFMSKSQSTTITDPKSKELWAACATCKGETAHVCLAEVKVEDESPDGDIKMWWQYYIIQCGGCKQVSFCEESQSTDDFDYYDYGQMKPSNTQKVYPGRIAGRPLMGDVYSLPHGVARIYEETHKAISNNQSILTGIGLRAIIEAVCSNKNISSGNLQNKIEELHNVGVLTKEGAQILHQIRQLGNKAAHEVKANTQDELFAAFEVVEHLLATVYVMPRKAARLKPQE